MIHILVSVLAYGRRIHSTCITSKIAYYLVADWNRTMVIDGIFEFVFISWCDVDWTSNDFNTWLRVYIKVAFSIFSSVGIVSFSSYSTSIFKILKGMRRKSTSASMIVIISSTIYKLLFTEVSELTILYQEVGFNCTNGWESPTGSTRSLILHWSHTSSISPIPVSRSCC